MPLVAMMRAAGAPPAPAAANPPESSGKQYVTGHCRKYPATMIELVLRRSGHTLRRVFDDWHREEDIPEWTL
jgi:hypothetical protein